MSLNDAIVIYLGYGKEICPKECSGCVTEKYGEIEGGKLVAEVRSLLGELNELKPDWSEHTLDSAAKRASCQMRNNHEELDELAISAFGWVFSWWWR